MPRDNTLLVPWHFESVGKLEINLSDSLYNLKQSF
jgi:hypothetical protein